MNLEQKQAAMKKRWEQIRPAPGRNPAPRAGGGQKANERPFGTVSLDTVCEIKQIGRLIRECTSRDTAIWFGIMARQAKQNTMNHVTKNLSDEFLRGLGEKV